MNTTDRIKQYITIVAVQAITLLVLSRLEGLQIESLYGTIGIAIAYLLANVIYWWSFINFFSYLPVWLYPLITFVVSGILMMALGNLMPGIVITDVGASLRVIVVLSGVSAILSGVLSLKIDQQFDRWITRRLVARHEKPIKTEVPGFLFLEIDGLSEEALHEALNSGHLPTLQRWIHKGTHEIIQWETDFTAQTGAIQSGILLGNNENIPAYRWWDRSQARSIRSGNFQDAHEIEKMLSTGEGLLSGGGTSRTNMFSGDADESLFTISTVLDRDRGTGPGFYMFLVNPFVIGRLITRFLSGVVQEWWQALRQKIRRDQYTINARNFFYGFIRAAESRIMQEITTYLVSSDILRGIPAIYTTYAGYDNICHYAGLKTPEAVESLTEIDRFFARLEYITERAPRPYHIVVLSDHGQTNGGTFKNVHGISLNQLIRNSISDDKDVVDNIDVDEARDHINAFLNESVQADTRTASVLRTMVRSKMHDGVVEVGRKEKTRKADNDERYTSDDEPLIVYGSGCVGLVYFTESKERLTYESIQQKYPDLILSLVQHVGIGFVMVRSSENGDLILSRGGIYYLDNDTYEGENPLKDFSPHAADLLRRENSFPNCADIVINTRYDPQTQEMCGFENQVSHHGGFGGPQSFPFILHPTVLPYDEEPVVGAVQVHRLLKGWREMEQSGKADE